MTRKTGRMAVKARQLTRAAKLAKYKRELKEAGIETGIPRPSPAAEREKEEELKRLYLDLFPQARGMAEREMTRQSPAEPSEQQVEKKGRVEQEGKAE